MTRASDSMDDLTGDIRHLTTLVRQITNIAIDMIDSDKTVEDYRKEISDLSDLLWIARDMVEQIADNSDAAHCRVLSERNAARKAVAA